MTDSTTRHPVFEFAIRALHYALLFVAALAVARVIGVVVYRITYPFELEWLEGTMLTQAQRALNGEVIYLEPNVTFFPSIYSPLYYYVSALFARFMGDGFFPMRLVSVLCTAGVFAVIYLLLKRETGRPYPGLIGASLFIATFQLSGNWFDLARVDMLFLLLLLLAVYMLRFADGWRGYVLAGVLVGLAAYTKQTALLAAAPLGIYALYRGWRKGLALGAATVAVVGGTLLVYTLLRGQWYYYFVYQLPSTAGILPEFIWGFWVVDLLIPLPFVCVSMVFGLVWLWRGDNRERALFYTLLLVGFLGAAYASRVRNGGYANVLLPGYAALSVITGLTLSDALKRRLAVQIGVCVLCLLQFANLPIEMRKQIPTERDVAAGNQLLALTEGVDGEVLLLSHPYLAQWAGKSPYLQRATGHVDNFDLETADDVRLAMVAEFESLLRQQHFAMILLDFPLPEEIEAVLLEYYFEYGPVFLDDDVFYPVTGNPARPQWIYLPRTDG